MLGARHPANRLLHEGPAEVVDPTGQHGATPIIAQLHPRALHVRHGTVEEQARHRMDGSVVPTGGPGARGTGEVERSIVVNERQGDELRKAAGAFLDRSQDT